MRSQEEPDLAKQPLLASTERHNLETNGREPTDTSIEEAAAEENPVIQSETVQDECE